MMFEDNFVEPLPGWLVDPVLKIRLNTSGHKESGPYDGKLNLVYDPEIRADRLTRPQTAERRAWLLSQPILAHRADEPVLYSSENAISITSLAFAWKDFNQILRLKISN